MSIMARAFFLDRDGTLNEDRGYVHKVEDFVFLPGAVEAIKMINRHGYLAVVVTNQSGVARGYYTRRDVEDLYAHVSRQLFAAGARIDAFYWCPHHPLEQCRCRKPRPGMLLRAAREMDIDLAGSVMVGDRVSDVMAGLGAGCRPYYIGGENPVIPGGQSVKRVDSLLAAVRCVLRREPESRNETGSIRLIPVVRCEEERHGL